jgi:hypothetical protein
MISRRYHLFELFSNDQRRTVTVLNLPGLPKQFRHEVKSTTPLGREDLNLHECLGDSEEATGGNPISGFVTLSLSRRGPRLCCFNVCTVRKRQHC